MKRIQLSPREDWQNKVMEKGLHWVFTDEGQYWDESAAYEFSEEEINKLYDTTEELHRLCMDAVQYVLDYNLLDKMGINPKAHALIRESWEKKQPHLYGRFDFLFDGKDFKMLEYNADTPTILIESSVIQWHWKQDVFPQHDQFNSLEEDLINRWKVIDQYYQAVRYHFSCAGESDEDYSTIHYLKDCLADVFQKNGLARTQFVSMEDIGWNKTKKKFLDLAENPITHMFKLYPYEWLIEEEFAEHIFESDIRFIEPWWKMILSNKAILPILWQLNPNHPALLPTFFEKESPVTGLNREYVIKPFYSREGANIHVVSAEHEAFGPERGYDTKQCVYQEFVTPHRFDGKIPLIGSWVIGNKAAGIGIREDEAIITSNYSRFVPHYFVKQS